MEDKKRVRRTRDELVADIDGKIAYHKERITALEEKKARILAPKPRKQVLTFNKLIAYAKAEGMSLEELADKIGYKLPQD